MKKILLACALMLIASTAQAELYYGAKLGTINPDTDALDATDTVSAVLGYEIISVGFDLSVEGEYTNVIKDGDVDGGGKWSGTSFGGYAVVRSPGPIYFKGRAGLVQQSIDVGGSSTDETLNAIGAGLGLSSGLFALEFDYTLLQEGSDISDPIHMLSVGGRF